MFYSHIPLSHIGAHVWCTGFRDGSTRFFSYQHVGTGNAKVTNGGIVQCKAQMEGVHALVEYRLYLKQ